MMKVIAELARAARARPITRVASAPARAPSLVRALGEPGIIAELKPSSPTAGQMRTMRDAKNLARMLLDTGACAISALTEPTRFGGSPALLTDAIAAGGPVLMKDFVVTQRQLDLARDAGASAVLLILPLLTREHSEWTSATEAVAAAHALGLEVVLEAYDAPGAQASAATGAEFVGINNRDLRDDALPVDPMRAARVLADIDLDIPVLALSGASTAEDVRRNVRAGAAGVLVGTSLMRAHDPCAHLAELLEGLA